MTLNDRNGIHGLPVVIGGILAFCTGFFLVSLGKFAIRNPLLFAIILIVCAFLGCISAILFGWSEGVSAMDSLRNL